MDHTNICATFSVEDGQTVFQALSELPFKLVYELIGKMNHVTNEADPIIRDGGAYYAYSFSKTEVDLILHALGQLPYLSVHQVIHGLEKEVKAHDAKT